ncbi:hypothetical protein SAMN05421854_13316 [Amycolatopsis rubida]|uniref:Uncharacterized protein n=2 Tax=Amycolatopsis rubida TaxID=112413 RepID=A0A1I6BMI7_9PSEU|nr:hypothetical protein SAMN05421854_13316 [Amycolatopsis rubida]
MLLAALEPDWLYVPGPEGVLPAGVELFVPDAEPTDSSGLPFLCLQYDSHHRVEGLSTADREARTVRWEIPLIVLNQEFADLLVRLAPLAAPVAEGLTVEVSAGRAVQRLSEQARNARERFGRELAAALADRPRLEIHAVPKEQMSGLVTADTDGTELAEILERLRAAVPPSRPGNYVVLDYATERHLENLRDDARRQVRDQLAHTARQANAHRRARDRLLRRISDWDDADDTGRGLAKLTDLSHTAVQKILRQNDEDGTPDDDLPTIEYTWRHNDYIASSDTTADRTKALDAARECRKANPAAGIVAVVRRHVTGWELDQQL